MFHNTGDAGSFLQLAVEAAFRRTVLRANDYPAAAWGGEAADGEGGPGKRTVGNPQGVSSADYAKAWA